MTIPNNNPFINNVGATQSTHYTTSSSTHSPINSGAPTKESIFNKKKPINTPVQAETPKQENVASTKTYMENGVEVVEIKYKDGSHSITKEGVTTTFDKTGNLISKQYTTINSNNEEATVTEQFLNNKMTEQTTRIKQTQLTTTFDENENPIQHIVTDKNNGTIETYDIDENGNRVLKETLINKDAKNEARITYESVDMGINVKATVVTRDGTDVQLFDTNGKLLGSDFTGNDGSKIMITQNDKTSHWTREAIDAQGNKVEDIYDENGQNQLYQSYTPAGGKTVSVGYDKNNNTILTVQPNENIETIAKRFGVDKQDLLKANGMKEGDELKEGHTFALPKKLSAADPRIQGRISQKEYIQQVEAYNKEIEKTQAQNRRNFEINEMGLDPAQTQMKGKKVTIKVLNKDTSYEIKERATMGGGTEKYAVFDKYDDKQFTLVGKAKHGDYYIARGVGKDSNQYYYLDGDLKEVADFDTAKRKQFFGESKEKLTLNVTRNNDKLGEAVGEKRELALTGQKDEMGNDIAIDQFGNTTVIDRTDPKNPKVIVDNYTLQQLQTRQKISNDRNFGEQTTIELMNSAHEQASKLLQQQKDSEGWAAATAETLTEGYNAVVGLANENWESNNVIDKVNKDLSEYEKITNELGIHSKKNDKEAFNNTFKKHFGKDYDPKSVANYYQYPTDENYEKAFGTKNDIVKRVMKYNQSQETGASAVKTAGAIGLAVASGGLGVVGSATVVGVGSAVAEYTDDWSSNNGLQDGDALNALKTGFTDGLLTACGIKNGQIVAKAITGSSKTAVARQVLKTGANKASAKAAIIKDGVETATKKALLRGTLNTTTSTGVTAATTDGNIDVEAIVDNFALNTATSFIKGGKKFNIKNTTTKFTQKGINKSLSQDAVTGANTNTSNRFTRGIAAAGTGFGINYSFESSENNYTQAGLPNFTDQFAPMSNFEGGKEILNTNTGLNIGSLNQNIAQSSISEEDMYKKILEDENNT